jgi:ADP-heptose:LPS heptosyltransferase
VSERQNILVIKHGALGDVVIATAGFAAIRATFPDANIVCLTGSAYATLLVQSPYFDEIWSDRKPKLRDREGYKRLKTMLNSRRWDWVFDLQGSQRSSYYQWLFTRPWPNINNASRWSSHGFIDPERKTSHALTRMQKLLAHAGITQVGGPNIEWLVGDIANLKPFSRFALLVPGGAPHRPKKRWPPEQYAALAHELVQRGIIPVLIGTEAEKDVLHSVALRVPKAVNLCGKTSIAQLASLAREAVLAVGNDTGPMHVIAATGCPCTVLFSHDSDPLRSAPIGAVNVHREANLAELSVDRVLASLTGRA